MDHELDSKQKHLLDTLESIHRERIRLSLDAEAAPENTDEQAVDMLEERLKATMKEARAAHIPQRYIEHAGERALLRSVCDRHPQQVSAEAVRGPLTLEEQRTFRALFLTAAFCESAKNEDGSPGPTSKRAQANMNREFERLQHQGYSAQELEAALQLRKMSERGNDEGRS